jgi:anti-sigma-K factor RskA
MMNDELHTLSGAYAVHALPYAEWVQFERHLHVCARCADEVRRLRETAARLAEAVAEPPPARLRSRLLDAACRSRGFEDPRDDSPTVWRPPAPVTPTGNGEGDSPTLRLLPEPGESVVVPLRRRTRVLAAMTAVSAAAAVALGVVAFDARTDLGELSSRNAELTAVLAAPDARTMRQPITSGGTGTLVISRERGRMVFASSGLPELPATQGYELWLMGPDGPRPAGLLHLGEDGMTTPMVLTPLGPDRHVALTVEPAKGSERPTRQPIMLAELPGA